MICAYPSTHNKQVFIQWKTSKCTYSTFICQKYEQVIHISIKNAVNTFIKTSSAVT